MVSIGKFLFAIFAIQPMGNFRFGRSSTNSDNTLVKNKAYAQKNEITFPPKFLFKKEPTYLVGFIFILKYFCS